MAELFHDGIRLSNKLEVVVAQKVYFFSSRAMSYYLVGHGVQQSTDQRQQINLIFSDALVVISKIVPVIRSSNSSFDISNFT